MTLTGIGRLLIDGNNLLHRVAGSADPAAVRVLLARLRAALPQTLPTTVMLDGHPAPGSARHQRVSAGLEIQHAGSLSADDALLNIVRATPAAARADLTIVSDDRALTDKARHLGAQTQRLAWLEQQLDARPPASGAIGTNLRLRPRPEPEREPWRPGRGATRKKGNPRREKR